MLRSLMMLIVLVGLATGCVTESAKQNAAANKANKAKSKPFQQLFAEAQAHYSIGKYEVAEEKIREVIKQKPGDERLYNMLADIQFCQGKIGAALENYDEMIRIKPEVQPYLWQRGLALYYAGEFQKGKEQFELHQDVNSQDVENSVWHLLCSAKTVGLEKARESMIAIEGDTRVPMAQVFELFAGRGDPDEVVAAAADSTSIQTGLYFAFLYNGLYFEMTGDDEKCLEAMEKAHRAKSSAHRDTLMNQIATVHLRLRAPEKLPSKGEDEDVLDGKE